jgi:hypothetical protein
VFGGLRKGEKVGGVVVFLGAALFAMSAAPREKTELPGIAGTYEGLHGASTCRLVVDAASGYRLACHGKPPINGSVVKEGNAILLTLPDGQGAANWRRYQQQLADCERASEAYRAQQFSEHGFYPALAPCSVAAPELSKLVVPVTFRERLHLVETFARDAFCGKSSAGGPHRPSRGYVFRSKRRGTVPQAIPRDTFCHRGWKLSFDK